MFVAIYPEAPSQALTSAVLGAGFQPVPVVDVADAGRKEPPAGWHAAVVELGDMPDLAIAVAGKLRDDIGVAVLIVVDRMLTADLSAIDGYDDFLLTPVDQTELKVRLLRLAPAIEAPWDCLTRLCLQILSNTGHSNIAASVA